MYVGWGENVCMWDAMYDIVCVYVCLEVSDSETCLCMCECVTVCVSVCLCLCPCLGERVCLDHVNIWMNVCRCGGDGLWLC